MAQALLVDWLQAGDVVNAGATEYTPIGSGPVAGTTTAADAERPVRDAGTIRNLLVRVTTNTIVGNGSATLYDSGAPTAVTVVITGLTAGDYEDASNSHALAATDELSCQLVGGAAGTSMIIGLIRTEFEADTNCVTLVGIHALSTTNLNVDSTTTFFPVNGGRGGSTTEADKQYTMRGAATWSDMSLRNETCTRTTNVTFTSRVNLGAGNQTIAADGAADNTNYEDSSNSDTLAADDEIQYAATTSTGGGGWNLEKMWSTLISTNSNFFMIVHGIAELINAGIVRFWPPSGSMSQGEESSEAKVRVPVPFAFTAEELIVKASAIAGLLTATVISRVEGGNGNQSVVLDAVEIVNDASNTDALVAGNDLNTQVTTSGGTNMTFQYVGMIGTVAAAATDTFAFAFYPNIGQRRIMMPSGGSRF